MTDVLAQVLPKPEEEELLRRIVETGVRVVGAQEGSILLFDSQRECLVFALTVGNPEAEKALKGQSVPLGQGTTGLAAATLDVQVGGTTYTGIDLGEKQDASLPDAVMAAPMVSGERLMGVVTAISFEPGRSFGSRDMKTYAEFARLAGSLIEHWRAVETMLSPETETTSPLLLVLRRLLGRKDLDQERLARLLEAVESLVVA